MITVNYEPSGYPSAHNPMFIELESNNSSQADFKYVFDIYVNNAFATRQKVFPDPTDNKGYLDISRVVGNYFDVAQPVINAGSVTPVELSTGEFYVDFKGIYGEEYSGTPFVSGNVSGSPYKAYNWTKSNFQRQIRNIQSSSAPTYFKSLSDYVGYFLTNRPQKTKVYRGQPLALTLWGVSGTPYDVTVDYYNGGTLQESQEIATAQTYTNPKVFDAGTTAVETFGSISTDTYEKFIVTGTDGTKNPSLEFEFICHPRYEPVTLMFLNRLGGWDSFTFGLLNQISIDTEKKSFGQNPFVGRSDLIGGGFVRESNKVFAVSYKTKWKLTGDSLTKDEYTWLAELFTSPLVYVYLSDSTGERNWHPVTITETNYTVKDHLSDKQNFIELNIEFAEPENSQYR